MNRVFSRLASFVASDVKKGMIIKHKDKYWEIMAMTHHSSGRGGATYKGELKQIGSPIKLQERFNPSSKVEVIELDDKLLTVMYAEGDNVKLIDSTNFEEMDVPVAMFPGGAKVIPFLNESIQIKVQMAEGAPINIKMPDRATYQVTALEAQASGNEAAMATLDNGFKLTVPAFIGVGQSIVVDLKSFKYTAKA